MFNFALSSIQIISIQSIFLSHFHLIPLPQSYLVWTYATDRANHSECSTLVVTWLESLQHLGLLRNTIIKCLF